MTTEGNIFYTHKAKKESVWTIPEEIKDLVDKLEKEETESKEREERAVLAKKEYEAGLAEQQRLNEIERIKLEVQEAVKRKAEDAPVDEVVISKKPRVEDVEEEDSDDESSEEEEWQREAAAQLAAEAEEEMKRVEEETKRAEEEAAEETRKVAEMPQLNMPARVDLSVEEAKALFKVCASFDKLYIKIQRPRSARLFSVKRI